MHCGTDALVGTIPHSVAPLGRRSGASHITPLRVLCSSAALATARVGTVPLRLQVAAALSLPMHRATCALVGTFPHSVAPLRRRSDAQCRFASESHCRFSHHATACASLCCLSNTPPRVLAPFEPACESLRSFSHHATAQIGTTPARALLSLAPCVTPPRV
uniref:Uncharacterized protein n=1 Tax=Chrysotila carterae TaxID=13221 RepID=A0A7S4F0G6_CHRCT